MSNDTPASRLTLERILDVARRHFAQNGYRKASLVDIARELGVVKGALYYHVPGGKLAMFNQIMAREEERLIEEMRAAAAREDDARTALRAAIEARFAVWRRLAQLLNVRREISEEISALSLAQEREFRRRERDLFEEIMQRGEEQGVFASLRPRRAAAAAIQAVVHGLTVPEIYARAADGPEDAGDATESAEADTGELTPSVADAFFELVFKGLEIRP
jgi:AcrR family transcriptional regulator